MLLNKYLPVWVEALNLAWPVILNHIFTTLMRTTDMLLMGYFGPAAVTAVGLGDVWERVVLRIGLGLGAGSISLISQEAGIKERTGEQGSDEILTQIIITGIIIGLPFIFIGLFFSANLIEILGAAPEVVRLGAQYLLIILAAAPFRILTLISARALQGTGDTSTPMMVDIISNVINITLSVGLSLGLGFFPELGVIGIGWGTFWAKLIAGVLYIIIFILPGGNLSLEKPSRHWNLTVAKQLLLISLPRSLQGGYQSLITFPFNSLVLTFGTEAAAAYHIARRIQQQIIAPLHRAYGTVTTIMAGKKLGEGKPAESKKITLAMLWLTALTIGLLSLIVIYFAPDLVAFFTDDPVTKDFARQFLRVLGLGAPILTLYSVISGLLTGAGDTRTPFYGLVFSQTLFKLGMSYILSIFILGNLWGVYIGLLLDYLMRMSWVGKRFLSNRWSADADKLISARHEIN